MPPDMQPVHSAGMSGPAHTSPPELDPDPDPDPEPDVDPESKPELEPEPELEPDDEPVTPLELPPDDPPLDDPLDPLLLVDPASPFAATPASLLPARTSEAPLQRRQSAETRRVRTRVYVRTGNRIQSAHHTWSRARRVRKGTSLADSQGLGRTPERRPRGRAG